MAEGGGNLIVKGELFSSYSEFEQELKKYEERNFVQLWRRHSRSLDSFRKRNKKRCEELDLPPGLKYCEVDMACVCGGRRYASHASEDGRPAQR